MWLQPDKASCLKTLINTIISMFQRVWDKSLTLNIKSEQNELSDTKNSVLFAFLSNLSIFKIYNKEFLKSKSFCPRLKFHLKSIEIFHSCWWNLIKGSFSPNLGIFTILRDSTSMLDSCCMRSSRM